VDIPFPLAGNCHTRDKGLGSLNSIGLADTRSWAAEQRSVVASGLDPFRAREAECRARAVEAASWVTFAVYASQYVNSHQAGSKNEKHSAQWASTIKAYCEPVIRRLPIKDIDTALILQILRPIWIAIPETASRLSGNYLHA